MKKIAILGSTGSIGKTALEVVSKYKGEIVLLSANVNYKLLAEQANRYKPRYLYLEDKTKYPALKSLLDYDSFILGTDLDEILRNVNYDIALNAIVGYAGLKSSIAVLSSAKNLALANKESLVIAGNFLKHLARKNSVNIIPVDSEHSAIYEVLRAYNNPVQYITLTASGGPFFNKSMKNVKPEDALKHPTWSMGRKISIDSATMVNKALEFIEAVHLFDIEPDKIDIVIHPQSLVHGMVEFTDGTLHAIISKNSMFLPIAKALFLDEVYQDVEPAVHSLFSLKGMNLEFYEPDLQKFRVLSFLKRLTNEIDRLPIAFNASNEELVYAFLNNKISFLDIINGISWVLDKFDMDDLVPTNEIDFINFVEKIDFWARSMAKTFINNR